jgi:hypothetical protein
LVCLSVRLAGQQPSVQSPLATPTLDIDEQVADLRDEEIVKRGMARTFSIEDAYRDPDLQKQLSQEVQELMRAAERRVSRANARMAIAAAQVEAGKLAPESLRRLSEDAQLRLDMYQLALSQSRLIEDVLEGARSDRLRPGWGRPARRGAVERYAGAGVFQMKDFRLIQSAYERKFFRPLPVSAFGDTALHRTLGLNHSGRVDVALNPDQREGVWLREFLQQRRIPYYAFRTAIVGSATAPHIHIGPGSSRFAPSRQARGASLDTVARPGGL